MDWLQRYVDNVKNYLPARQGDDIGRELYSSLQDQCDDMAGQLGRELDESEIQGLLKQKGHPMKVAAAYQPRRTLVSEALFPLYLLVLKWVFLAMIITQSVFTILGLLGQAEINFTRVAFQWLAAAFEAGLHSFAWVTLGFYLAGESISYSDVFGKWDPKKLPKIAAGGQRISQFESLVELVAVLIVMVWLNDIFAIVQPAGASGVQFEFSEAVLILLPWLNVVMIVSIAMAIHKLLFPFWTKSKLVFDSVINVAWLILLTILFSADRIFSVRWDGLANDIWEMPARQWQLIIAVTMAITLYDLLKNIRNFLRG